MKKIVLAAVQLSTVGLLAIGIMGASSPATADQAHQVLAGGTMNIPRGQTCHYTSGGLSGDLSFAIALADVQGTPTGQFVQNVTIQPPFATKFPNYLRVCLNEPASGGRDAQAAGVHVTWVVFVP